MPLPLVTDKLPHPMSPLRKPEPGETYQDPAFGQKVTRITATDSDWGENACIKPAYSTVPAWNADESYLMLWQRGVGHLLYQGDSPYERQGSLGLQGPADEASVYWDPEDPALIYYLSEYRELNVASGIRLMKCAIRPTAVGFDTVHSVVHDFGRRPLFFSTSGETISAGGDPQWMSREGRLIGARIGRERVVYSIDRDQVWLTYPFPGFDIYQNAFAPTPSGERYLFDRYVYDADTLAVKAALFVANPYEHGCMGRMTLLEEGAEPERRSVDCWNMTDFDSRKHGTFVNYRLDLGLGQVIIGPETGYPYPPSGTHLSSLGPDDLVAIGVVGDPAGQGVLDNEILLANVATKEVARLCHARTYANNGRWNYWSETHPCISPTGTRVVFGSDWGNSFTVDTYVVDLRDP